MEKRHPLPIYFTRKSTRALELGSRLEMWGKRKRDFEDALVFDFY
jgi:hypothetical protein